MQYKLQVLNRPTIADTYVSHVVKLGVAVTPLGAQSGFKEQARSVQALQRI